MKYLTDNDFVAFVGRQESQFVAKPSDFRDETVERFESRTNGLTGDCMPWGKTHDKIRFRPGEVSLWPGINGHGKALSLDTEIPTPTGWKNLADIHPGDVVFDENGSQCNVVAETPVQIGRPCFNVVFSDGSEIIADEQHEWLTWTAKARQSHRNAKRNNRIGVRELQKSGTDQTQKRTMPAIRTTKEISDTVKVKRGCWKGLNEHSVQVAGAIRTKDKALPIEPYMLGVWLGDGDSYGGGFTTADDELCEAFVANGYQTSKSHQHPYRYSVYGLVTDLRKNELYRNKHIPSQYLRAPIEQRLSLLQGLMDTYGHITNYGRCEFTSVNKGMANDVLELVVSLGVQAKLITGRATLYGKDCGEKYRVTFTPDFPAFRLERKAKYIKTQISDRAKHRFIVSCEPVNSVPVKCIEVDSGSHLYLASRSFIPTHNSLALGQCMAWLLPTRRCLIASMEMKPAATLERILRQCAGNTLPSRHYMDNWFRWTDDKLWLYDQNDTVAPERIIGMIHYAAQELKIEHIVIDSLMKCGIRGQSDAQYAGQRDFVDRLAWAAKSHNCHIHLVHHMRKGDKEAIIPDKFDIRGAGEVADMVDNIFIAHRNKRKERAKEKGEAVEHYEPDQIIRCDKQRNGEWEGTVNLYFDPPSQQFVPNPDKGALYWPGMATEDWKRDIPDNVRPLCELYEPGMGG